MAHLVLALTVLVWSFSFLAAARLRQDLGLTEALAARFVPVLLGSGAYLLARRPLRIPRAAWPKVVAMGLLSVPAYNVFFFHGLKTVPSGTGALVIALNPVFTAVLARAGGNVAQAAEHAGVDRVHFYRLLRKHGIKPRT